MKKYMQLVVVNTVITFKPSARAAYRTRNSHYPQVQGSDPVTTVMNTSCIVMEELTTSDELVLCWMLVMTEN